MSKKNALAKSRIAYSVSELVRVTSIGRTLLYEQISKGNLIARKVGARTIVTRSDALKWLETLSATSEQSPRPGLPKPKLKKPRVPY